MLNRCQIKNPLCITRFFSFFERDFSGGFFFKGESHNFYEVVCVISGTVGITSGKNVYTLNKGEMTFHMPNEFHAIWEEDGSNSVAVIFSFEASAFPTASKRNIFSLGEGGIDNIKAFYREALELFEGQGPDMRIRHGCELDAACFTKKLEIFLLSLFNKEIKATETSVPRASVIFSKIISVMEKNIEGTPSVEELARESDISVPTLEKIVSKYIGYGAIAYFNVLKLQRAHTMLIGGANVKQTALSLGYSNQNYFSARFKKYFGYPPSSVRRE